MFTDRLFLCCSRKSFETPSCQEASRCRDSMSLCGDRCRGKYGGCDLSSMLSLPYSPLAHAPGSQCKRVWALVPAPNSPVVCLWLPSSDMASLSPLWSRCTHGLPVQPLPVLRTPHCSVHFSAPCGQCPLETPTDKMKDKILKPTGRLAFFIHTLADGSNQMQEKS